MIVILPSDHFMSLTHLKVSARELAWILVTGYSTQIVNANGGKGRYANRSSLLRPFSVIPCMSVSAYNDA